MSKKKWLIAIPVILMLAYFAGPSPARPSYSISMPVVPASAPSLENYILQKENQHHLKPDNEARIIWYNDSMKNKTDCAIVYLHGFSASQFEGAPTHSDIANPCRYTIAQSVLFFMLSLYQMIRASLSGFK